MQPDEKCSNPIFHYIPSFFSSFQIEPFHSFYFYTAFDTLVASHRVSNDY